MSITRKEFIGSLLGGAALLACGGNDTKMDSAQQMRNCAMNGTNVTIAENHGHVLTVTPADINGGADKTYDITGTATHPHMVTVTAANFATLQSNANGSVQVTSTVNNTHSHVCTIVCA